MEGYGTQAKKYLAQQTWRGKADDADDGERDTLAVHERGTRRKDTAIEPKRTACLDESLSTLMLVFTPPRHGPLDNFVLVTSLVAGKDTLLHFTTGGDSLHTLHLFRNRRATYI